MTYLLKFRQHLLNIQKKEGLTFDEAEKRFRVGIASVVRWTQHPKADEKTRQIFSEKIVDYESAQRFIIYLDE